MLRVRIAVAVDSEHAWSAVGNCAYQGDEEAATAAVDDLPLESSGRRHLVFVTAEVPVPLGLSDVDVFGRGAARLQ
jgi:hypothetical protein